MSMIRRERRQWTPEPWIPPFPGASYSGSRSTSIDSALQVSAVWACVRLVADTVAMMDLNAFTMKQGVRVPMPNPPLLTSPSGDATLPEWIYMIVASLMLNGNAYGRVTRRDAQLYPMQIDLLNPSKMAVRTDQDTGKLVYTNNGTLMNSADVMHIRAYRMPGSSMGLSPIQYAAPAINRELAIQIFAGGYFTDAPHPQAILTSDASINDEQARSIKDRILAKVIGREPLILGAGLKYQTLSVSPEESQFLATQKLGVAEIARVFGVPPEMIAAEAGNSMTYANIQSKGIDFLTYSIQPWLSRLESAISQLMPGGKHVRFDPTVLLRTDLMTQLTATAIGIASKQMTPDEARSMADLPPLTDAQKTLLSLVPMDVGPTGKPKLLPPSPGSPPAEPPFSAAPAPPAA
jgi:HK97 family phage portal protein